MSQTVLITGASGGIGNTLARLMHQQGWQLALVSREKEKLSSFDNLTGTLLIEADVSTVEGAQQAIKDAQDHFEHTPQALAHCAGSTLLSPLHRTREQQYRDCMRANLDSSFFMLGEFIKACIAAKQPAAAVLASSVVARIGVSNHEAIAAAKAGVEGLVRSAAAGYANQNIRVNAIAPGLIRTPATEKLFASDAAETSITAQYPLGRYGYTDDGANAMAWLLSNDASWITGQIIPIDGGFSSIRPLVKK